MFVWFTTLLSCLLVFNYDKEEHNVIVVNTTDSQKKKKKVVNTTGYNKCLASPNLGAFDSGKLAMTR